MSQLDLTPQLQLAITLLATPSRELPDVVERYAAARPGTLAPLAIGEEDPSDEAELDSAADDDRPAFLFSDDEPFPQRGADVWVYGNPPHARANSRAFPRMKIVGGSKDHQRECAFLVRCLRTRARNYQAIVAGCVAQQPALALATSPDVAPAVSIEELAVALGLHASTISRAAAALTFQNLHGVFGLSVGRSKLSLRAA